jgi:hypothetical protein
LIGKISTIAGIARTSEIMNVEYLTVGDESVVETEEFKGISVTSEKWLPMYQVKKEDLKDYLEY